MSERMVLSRMRFVCAVLAVLVVSASAWATVSVNVWYRGGEEEPKAVGDTWAKNEVVLDSSSNGLHLGAGNVQGVVEHITNDGSTVAYALDAGIYGQPGPVITEKTTALQNWGVEAWIRTLDSAGNYTMVMIGRDSWSKGFVLAKWADKFVCSFPGQGVSSVGGSNDVYIPVTPGLWVHMAVVNEDGVNTMYWNGQAIGTWSGSPDTSDYVYGNPPQTATTQMDYVRLGFGIQSTALFPGYLDEVRVFRFNSGEFDVADLLYDEQPDQGPMEIRAWYRGGETETKAIGDVWASNEVVSDATGNGRNLIAAAYLTAQPGVPGMGSDVSYSGRSWTSSREIISEHVAGLQNWGVEAWIRPDSYDSNMIVMIGREDYSKGFSLEQWADKLVCRFAGQGINSTGGDNDVYIPVVPGEWVHMAVVNEDGTNTMYANGQAVGTWAGSPDTSDYVYGDPPQTTTNQMQYNRIGWGINSDEAFVGLVDEVRVFRFESGQFDPAYLLYPGLNDPTTCQEVIGFGYGLSADLNKDCYVEWADFGMFAAQWQECNEPGQAGCQQNW